MPIAQNYNTTINVKKRETLKVKDVVLSNSFINSNI